MRRNYLLFVEDNEDNRKIFTYAVQEWNEANAEFDKEFCAHMATSYDDAVEALKRFKFDCALLDLRLPESNNGQDSPDVGNALATEVLYEQGLPLAILSGHPAEIDESLSDLQFIKAFNKGDEDGYDKALTWLAEKWEMMETLRSAKTNIDKSAATVFAKRLWPQWSAFSQLENGDFEKLTAIISRQYVSHIADLLGLDNDAAVGWHPYESYNVPSLFDARANTGDIFRIEDQLWVILSPQCDMATKKITNGILAKCTVGLPNWMEHIEVLKNPSSQTKTERANKYFRDLVNQNLPVSSHFLPPLPGTQEALSVSFAEIRTVELTTLNSNLQDRVASVSNPFISNLVQRFGAYISRTGQPNLEVAHFLG